jgi:hypothetical protein
MEQKPDLSNIVPLGSIKAVGRTTTRKSSTPAEATRAVEVSLKSHLKLSPVWSAADAVVGFEVSGDISDGMRELLISSAAPLSGPELSEVFTKLYAKTIRRAEGEMDAALMVAAYAEELQEYPADVVVYVLKMSAKNNKFFPAWAELYEDLEFWGRRRMLLADAIMTVNE